MPRSTIRAFIRPPFGRCESCHQQSYGVVHHSKQRVLRQCRHCGWEGQHALPPIKKRVLYVDQFLVSEYAKTEIGGALARASLKENERKALGAIGRLRACQLVVCPISDYHRQESIRDSRHREFKRAYAAFSGGAEWATTGEIEARQAYRHASGWIRQQAVEWTFPLEEALHETGDGWEADYSIILDMGDHAQRRAEADRVATSTTRDLQSLTEQWRRGATSFEAVFRAEAQQACWTHIKLAGEADARYREAVARGQPDAWMLHPGETRSGLWLNEVWRAFQEAGIPSDKLIETTARYAREADFTTLPYQRIADLTPAN